MQQCSFWQGILLVTTNNEGLSFGVIEFGLFHWRCHCSSGRCIPFGGSLQVIHLWVLLSKGLHECFELSSKVGMIPPLLHQVICNADSGWFIIHLVKVQRNYYLRLWSPILLIYCHHCIKAIPDQKLTLQKFWFCDTGGQAQHWSIGAGHNFWFLTGRCFPDATRGIKGLQRYGFLVPIDRELRSVSGITGSKTTCSGRRRKSIALSPLQPFVINLWATGLAVKTSIHPANETDASLKQRRSTYAMPKDFEAVPWLRIGHEHRLHKLRESAKLSLWKRKGG